MEMRITESMAQAAGLAREDASTVLDLVAEWREHYEKNRLRDAYYYGHVDVKDLGVSVSPQLMKRLNPHVSWAAKCVDWWADRVQFDGVTVDDEAAQETLDSVLRDNDIKNLMHKTVSVALRHSCAFMSVEQDERTGATVVSAYPATASSALYDDAQKRIYAGMVVVESTRLRGSRTRWPKTVHVYTDDCMIELTRDGGGPWRAEYVEHGMGRVPMRQVAYHGTLEQPFGRSRINRSVRDLVDDAQREMANMAAAASFSAAPQKFLLDTDRTTAEKIAASPFSAYIGSVLTVTHGKDGQSPKFGQLAQMSMQPHIEYMRLLASQFSNTTGVPLSSLGVVSDNPSSAEAIYAGKEDAVVDIQAFIDGVKRALSDVCLMALASEDGLSFPEEKARGLALDVHFRKPDRPSTVSQSQAIMSQVQAIPWLADSDVALRELGYDDEQVHQLRSDRRKAQGSALAAGIAYGRGALAAGAATAGQGGQPAAGGGSSS